MSFRTLAVALGLLAPCAPATALGHEGNPSFRSEIRDVVPEVGDVRVEVLDYDDSLRLTNAGEETVVVEGYDGEPYVRIRPDGAVEVNRRSPSHYLNDDRFADVEVPRSADAGADPEWELVDRSGQYAWHDHRIHYMARGTPSQVTDEGERTRIFDYAVPLEVGDQRAELRGTLWWVGPQDEVRLAPIVGLVAAILLGAGLVVVLRRRRRRSAGERSAPPGEAW